MARGVVALPIFDLGELCPILRDAHQALRLFDVRLPGCLLATLAACFLKFGGCGHVLSLQGSAYELALPSP